MRIAITGASGFVGRHVLAELRKRPVEIVQVTRPGGTSATAIGAGDQVAIDVANPGKDPFASMGHPDLLIHLAWAGLPHYQSPHHTEAELPAQIHFLESCVRAGLRRVVVTGTCFEYGDVQGELVEDRATAPVTRYGAAKDALRGALESVQRDHPFELAWLRLFYVFGDGQSSRSLYTLLQRAILDGDSTFDMSGGEQLRDFIPIADAARLIVDVSLLSGNTGIVNICSGQPITVKQQVETWLAEAGASIAMNLGRIPYSDIEPMAFWGSRRKLDALVGKP